MVLVVVRPPSLRGHFLRRCASYNRRPFSAIMIVGAVEQV
jgi:hypothetical protein